jgi:hypothetical protein
VWRFAAPIGFFLVMVDFALQLPAACAAKNPQPKRPKSTAISLFIRQ